MKPPLLNHFAAGAVICCLILPCVAAEEPVAVPPPEQWIVVGEVSEEYDYVRRQRSPAGGKYEVVSQSTGEVGERHYDQLVAKCTASGQTKVFTFDVTSIFAERDFADSKEAETKTHRELDGRFPSVTAELLPELQRLLAQKNPHQRTWAIARLAELKTAAADTILLDAYERAGLLEAWKFEAGLTSRGEAILPLVAARLKAAKPAIPWSLLDILEGIPTAARRTHSGRGARSRPGQPAEGQAAVLHGAGDGRRCRFGRSSAEGAGRGMAGAGRTALVWALGRCQCQAAVPRLRELLDSQNEEGRLAATYSLGLLGDRQSLSRLLEIATSGTSHNARHNAILALGHLRAKEAVPLLLEYLQPLPSYNAHYSPRGLFGPRAWTTEGNYIDASIWALGQIGDSSALPELRRILRHDRYYLNYDEAAAVAAELKWVALVPDIIDRLEKDYQHNVKLFGKERERYSPALRKLTGQKFGEDPRAWREWFSATDKN